VAVQYYYDAFGAITEQTANVGNPFKYSGYEHDEEIELFYLKSRHYDPSTARFMQEDAYRGNMADPLSLNLYTYCSGNPIKYWDPSGHKQVFVATLANGATWNEYAGGYVDKKTGSAA